MNGTLGEIVGWAPNFAPQSWAFCSGQLLSISSNTALFSLLGTNYGGDGRTTFGLPDLRGRVVVGAGSGPGLSPRSLGQSGGINAVTLSLSQMPSHGHSATLSGVGAGIPAVSAPGTTDIPTAGANLAAGDFVNNPVEIYGDAAGADTTVGGLSLTASVDSIGGGVTHENRDPYLGLNYIICLQGLFPSRN